MTSDQLLKIVEKHIRKIDAANGDITVTQIADRKTVFVEQIEDQGRVVMLSEYKVDGATYWAGFSSRSQTVYISQAA